MVITVQWTQQFSVFLSSPHILKPQNFWWRPQKAQATHTTTKQSSYNFGSVSLQVVSTSLWIELNSVLSQLVLIITLKLSLLSAGNNTTCLWKVVPTHGLLHNQLSSKYAWQILLKCIFLTGAMKSTYVLSRLDNNPMKALDTPESCDTEVVKHHSTLKKR